MTSSTTSALRASGNTQTTSQRRGWVDVALVLALCLLTIWPLLQKPGLPNGSDTLYHIYRTAEMARSWSHGILMPRWAETLYFGYGSPLFHYYASLTYYLTSIFGIFGLDAVDSLRLLIVLCSLLAGAGMYLFLRLRVSAVAGVIGALVYVYSPYLLYKEPYARGDYPELLALALFPAMMWLFERLLRRGGGVNFALAAVSVLLLINAHNLMAVVLTGLLGVWLVWNGVLVGWRGAALALGALVCGVGLAAYFWLPVLIEHNEVQLNNLIVLSELDYRNFFVPLRELLAFPQRLDGGAINGLMPLSHLGPAQWGLALTGVVGTGIIAAHIWQLARAGFKPAPTKTRQHLHTLIFFAVMAALTVFLITTRSEAIWSAVPQLSFLQFPWRFLGPAVFCLAVLAGMNAVWLERLPVRFALALTAALVVVPVALALPLLYVPEWINTDVDASVTGYHAAEVGDLQLGTTYSSEFLPVTVKVRPEGTQSLLDDYADGYPVDHANREVLPQGVTLELLGNTPQASEWQVQADHAFTLEVLRFHFAGWQAEVDGAPVPIYPSDPHGFITLDVPEGAHTVRVFMGRTSASNVGGAVTLAAAGVLVVVTLYLRRNPGRLADERQTVPAGAESTPLQPAHRYAILAGGLVAVALMALLLQEGRAWVESPPGTALAAQQPVRYDLGEHVRVIGYDLNGQQFSAGDRLELAVYWYSDQPTEHGYRSFVHISTGGPPLAQADKINPAGRPTKNWNSSGYIYDPYVIVLPADMPPGEYQIYIGLYTCDTRPPGQCGNGERLPVADDEGRSLGDTVPLATITVR